MSDKVKNIIHIIFLFCLLLLPNIFCLLVSTDLEFSWLKKFVYLFTTILFLFCPALILKARTYFIVEGIFNFFFFPIEIASLYLNKQSVSVPFLQNIFHTNWQEVIELLMTVWPLCMIVILTWIFYFILTAHLHNEYLFGKRIGIFLFIVFSFILASLLYAGFQQKIVKPDKPTKAILIDSFYMVWIRFEKIYPYDLYLNTIFIIRKHHHICQMEEKISNFHFGVQPPRNDTSALYILVIGESSRYDHWGLNGYIRPTTPRLSARSNVISFDSVFSLANLTYYSLPHILTRSSPLHQEFAFQEKALPDAFQEAGFITGFFTMQQPFGIIDRIILSTTYAYNNENALRAKDSYDGALIEQVRIHTQDTLQFFVLHTLGSHFRYRERYPDLFNIFTPVMETSLDVLSISEKNKQPLINAYDNSILYTDYLIDELIAYINHLNRPAVVLYVSDHGENLWDDERKLSFHGSYQVSMYEYHVPLVVWYSDKYATAYPDKVAAMRANKTTPVSTDVIFYSMLDIAGIEGAANDSTRSICSPALAGMDSIFVQTGAGDVVLLPLH